MPAHYQERIKELTEVLENEPIPARIYDTAKLEPSDSQYRIRIGGIRVVYEVNWVVKRIEILKIDWRGGVYK